MLQIEAADRGSSVWVGTPCLFKYDVNSSKVLDMPVSIANNQLAAAVGCHQQNFPFANLSGWMTCPITKIDLTCHSGCRALQKKINVVTNSMSYKRCSWYYILHLITNMWTTCGVYRSSQLVSTKALISYVSCYYQLP